MSLDAGDALASGAGRCNATGQRKTPLWHNARVLKGSLHQIATFKSRAAFLAGAKPPAVGKEGISELLNDSILAPLSAG